MTTPLQFWFDFASTYSYVAALRIEDECARAGVALSYRPFLLGPLFQAQLGVSDSPFNVHPLRGRYMWRDLERLCQKHGLAWRRPGVFPRNSVLASKVACAGAGLPWQGAFVRAVFAANFARDQDIADPGVLAALVAEAGAGDALERASSDEVRAALRRNTAEATALGFFGAPDFLVAGEHFFGQDRLEDALAWAQQAERSG